MKKYPFFFIFILAFFFNCLELFSENSNEENTRINYKILSEPVRGLGFFTLDLLNKGYSNIENYNQNYINNLMKAKEKVIKSDVDGEELFNKAETELTLNTKIQTLAYIPMIFGDFKDIETAFNLITGSVSPNESNQTIYNVIRNTLFMEYRNLDNLAGDERITTDDFIKCMGITYKDFYSENFNVNTPEVKNNIKVFTNEWEKEFVPALNSLNFNELFNSVNIILVPVIPKHDFLYRNIVNQNNVFTLQPSNLNEVKSSLWYTYYEFCYNLAGNYIDSDKKLLYEKLSEKNRSELYLLLLENTARQIMYEGLRAANPKMLSDFFSLKYGNLKNLLNNNLLEKSIKITGRDSYKEEIEFFKKALHEHPQKTTELLFKNGYLVPLGFLSKFRNNIKEKLEIEVNTEAAVALCRVLFAIHEGRKIEEVENLIASAFKHKAYELANHDYNTYYENKNNRVSLGDFKKFLLGLCEYEIKPLGNSSLQNVASNYVDAVNDPSKYLKAIEEYNVIPNSLYRDVLKEMENWLPEKIKGEKVDIWLLFNMKPDIQTFGNNIYIDVFSCLDDDGNLDKELYFKALCYVVCVFAYNKLDTVKGKINYRELPDDSKLKMITYFIDKFIRVGIAGKIAFNIPGVITGKFNKKAPTYWITKDLEKSWVDFGKHDLEIFNTAKLYLNNILDGKYKTFDEFIIDYEKYFYTDDLALEKVFTVGNRFFLGCEIMGSIYQAYGKDGIDKVAENLFDAIPLFNKALEKNKPADYKKYMFPEEIVEKLNYKFLSEKEQNHSAPLIKENSKKESDKSVIPVIDTNRAERNIGRI